ncbi:MAG TPA: hypothetical protein VFQ63_02710 [Patescibacteria group bacterium]|nr:hypothetical protein [Patescibacteria group bacterium]
MKRILFRLRRIIDPYAKEPDSKLKKPRKKLLLNISKRQKFIISVAFLSVGLFASEYIFANYTLVIAFLLGILTDVCLFVSLYNDLQEELTLKAFILPFLCSLSFSLFFFLTPARFISRVILTSLYAIALYSLFLSENIFLVASVRTIALLNSARIVTFVITLVSYFFLSNTILSFRLSLLPTVGLFFIISAVTLLHALWTYTLERNLLSEKEWVGVLSLCLAELAAIFWFWPTVPTVLALFLTSALYIFTGLSHMWFDKRLFRGVIWEYAWVGVFATILLFWFTHWQG